MKQILLHFIVSLTLLLYMGFTTIVIAQTIPPSPTQQLSPSPALTPTPQSSPSPTTRPIPSPTSSVQSLDTTEISGEVLTNQGGVLTIQTNQGSRRITIPSAINLTRNGLEAELADIQPGDQVTIRQTDTGQVLSLSATAGEVADWSQYLIPGIILTLLAIGAIWYILKKSNRSHIKTTSE